MLGLLLHIYLAIFCLSVLCFACYLRFWWYGKNTTKSNSRHHHKADYHSQKYKYSAGVVDNEQSSVSSVQGTTMLIVHNTPMGLISEELDEDLKRLSMNSNNSSYVLYSLPSPTATSGLDKMNNKLRSENVSKRPTTRSKLAQDIIIRVEDYDELQNEAAAHEVINLKGNLDLPMGEEPNFMEDKPMPVSEGKRTSVIFNITNLRSKDSEVLV